MEFEPWIKKLPVKWHPINPFKLIKAITDALEEKAFRSFALTYTVPKCYKTCYLMTQFIDLSVTRPQCVNLQNLGSRPMLDPREVITAVADILVPDGQQQIEYWQ